MKMMKIAPLALAAALLVGCSVSTPSPDSPSFTPMPSASETSEAVPEVTETPSEPVETVSESPVAPEPEMPSEEPVAPQNGEMLTVDALNLLNVADETNAQSYDRSLFNHWTRNNDTGCDTRFAVLVSESTAPVTTDGCKVTGGSWFSVYDLETVTDASKLDIDHMVPLAEAWRSGAYAWDSNTREAFANDLDYEHSLLAVTASSNRSKSDQDPSSWKSGGDACEYVGQWVGVKYRWSLSVDPAEKDAINQVLAWCENASIILPAQAAVVSDNTAQPDAAPPVSESPVVSETDPQFSTCKEAKSNGFGPYIKGQDVEYDWYRDGDGDGIVCE